MKRTMQRLMTIVMIAVLMLPFGSALPVTATSTAATTTTHTFCDDNAPLCAETMEPYTYEGKYIGHDEPAVLFYSNVNGSGNSNVYRLTLPGDPSTLPTQNGTGGTFNFQLHPAFWFGMAMGDNQ